MTTKFNIGDEVWYLNQNKKAVCGKIYKIEATAEVDKPQKTLYFAKTDESIKCVDEDEVFPTKRDLEIYIFG